MNNFNEQEIHYLLLKILAEEPRTSQREMARRTGVSLGKTNCVLTELANKGIITIRGFKSARYKIPYTYMLTPEGLEEKSKITLKFLKRKLSEYEEMKRQIKEIASEAHKDETIDLLSDAALKQLIRIQ